MRHIISVLVENHFGVLSRVAGLFSGRGYNIESLSVNTTDNPETSVMTIVTRGDNDVVEQIIKQLRKLINVLKVREVTSLDHIEREMVLVKVFVPAKLRSEVFMIVDTFRAKVVDLNSDSMVIEVTGTEDKIRAFLDVVRPYGIIEVIRGGVLAITRGSKETTESAKKA